MNSTVKFGERFIQMLVWLVIGMLATFAILGYAQTKGGDNFIGRGAAWLNDHLHPQTN